MYKISDRLNASVRGYTKDDRHETHHKTCHTCPIDPHKKTPPADLIIQIIREDYLSTQPMKREITLRFVEFHK